MTNEELKDLIDLKWRLRADLLRLSKAEKALLVLAEAQLKAVGYES